MSRRDDLQSLMYLIVYMFKGKLPWIDSDSPTVNVNNNNDNDGKNRKSDKNQAANSNAYYNMQKNFALINMQQ